MLEITCGEILTDYKASVSELGPDESEVTLEGFVEYIESLGEVVIRSSEPNIWTDGLTCQVRRPMGSAAVQLATSTL